MSELERLSKELHDAHEAVKAPKENVERAREALDNAIKLQSAAYDLENKARSALLTHINSDDAWGSAVAGRNSP